MDEKLLEEQRKTEALEAAMEEVRKRNDDAVIAKLAVRAEGGASAPEADPPEENPMEENLPKTGAGWFGLEDDEQ